MIGPGRLVLVVALVSAFLCFAGPATAQVASASAPVADSTSRAVRDSILPTDSGKVVPSPVDSSKMAAVEKRSLPPRTLSLRHQVMFAGGFMAFVALMMTSMQNFNP
jgi:hypothetical protein